MMKLFKLFVFFLFLQPVTSFAQSTHDHSDEIDREIWAVFKKAYDNRDAAAFNAIHADDVLRVGPSHMRIGEAYKKAIESSFSNKDRPKPSIDFAFEHRVHHEDVAYEVGYYRVRYEGRDEASFGRFHVVIRKIDEKWKITQDWDSDNINGHQVGAADFDRLKNKNH